MTRAALFARFNRVARNRTVRKIPHLVEQILHLPLPDVAGEVPDVDRAAPAPAHPSPLTYPQSNNQSAKQPSPRPRPHPHLRNPTQHPTREGSKIKTNPESSGARGTNHPRNDEERRFLPDQLWPEIELEARVSRLRLRGRDVRDDRREAGFIDHSERPERKTTRTGAHRFGSEISMIVDQVRQARSSLHSSGFFLGSFLCSRHIQ